MFIQPFVVFLFWHWGQVLVCLLMSSLLKYISIFQKLHNLVLSSIYRPVSRIFFLHSNQKGRDSSVGIATCYGLDGPGIGSGWGRDFPHSSTPVMGPSQPPIVWVPGLSRGWRFQPTPSNAEVKERVWLCLFSLSDPSWPVLRWTCTFTCLSTLHNRD
jgi:hypothetical protein